MTTTASLPTCWIIDHNPGAADSLRLLLQTGEYGQVLGTSASVADWAGQSVDYLFIRITAWDDYLQWRSNEQRQAPGTIIFLSGRFEKCSQRLPEDIDFYLKPPYRPGHIGEMMRRRNDPDFRRRPLDFFFLKVNYQFRVIRFPELLYVQGNGGGTILVRTAHDQFTISGTLTAFQRRFPISWQRVNRSLLVAR